MTNISSAAKLPLLSSAREQGLKSHQDWNIARNTALTQPERIIASIFKWSRDSKGAKSSILTDYLTEKTPPRFVSSALSFRPYEIESLGIEVISTSSENIGILWTFSRCTA